MPTLVSAVAPLVPLMLPKTSELLCVTSAFAPRAVANVRLLLAETSAPKPIVVLLLPVVLFEPEPDPKNALLKPVVLLEPAPSPENTLLNPVVLRKPALNPKKELLAPDVLLKPTLSPKKALLLPIVFNW